MMDEEEETDNEVSKEDNQQERREISSYGISIDTNELQPVDTTVEDGNELERLGINAYEQDQFESGIIRQVDSQIAEAEVNFQRNVTKKEIGNLETEIRNVEKEITDIEDIFTSAKNGDPLYTRRISFSLLQRKQSKETQLKQLQKKVAESYSQLEELNRDPKAHIPDTLKQQQEDLIKLGKITPFDALKAKQGKNSFAQANNKAERIVNSEIAIKDVPIQAENAEKDPETEKEIDLEIEKELEQSLHPPTSSSSSASSRKRKKKTATSIDSDDEYVPHKISTDEEEYDDNDGSVSEKRPVEKKKKKTAVNNPTKKKEKSKVQDDGDFNCFKERIRKLKVKKRLKEACKNGEVQEEYNPSDFSETTDEEDNTVPIEDDFVLDKKIWNKLYRYQRVGVKWLWQLHKQQVGGIIGDEMGLGKTIQIIAFLVGLMDRKEIVASFHGNKGLGPILIVCPATVLHQWVAEFHKWGPKFRVAIMHDSGSFIGRKATLIKAINSHPGVLITTYAGVRLNKEELYRYHWNYVILDEGHKIRNPDSDVTLAVKQFDTPHRIILTGTPMQNSLKELWSLFDFVYPGRLGTLPVFMAEFSVPITMGGYANASAIQVQTAHRCATVLKDTINPYMMRRMKKDVQMTLDLPQKSEQVLFCKLSEEQKTLYKEYINSTQVAAMLTGRMKIFPGLIKLRKICNHPDLAFLEPLQSSKHGANGKKDSEKKSSIPQFQPSQYDYEGGYGFWKRAGKMLVVESLLRMWREKNHRVLLFTQSKQMLNILETFVQSVEYTYMRMDGETNIGSRQTMVKKFNEDPSIFVFLLTTRVGGLGLNLIGADRIIIYDPDWNPSTDSQARERSWRIGQLKNVTIYRLMTTGTIEEKIYHRQIFKQFLTNRVLSNPFQRRFFKANDLYELFSLDDIGPQQTTETGALFAGTGSEIKMRNIKRKREVSNTTSGEMRKNSSVCCNGISEGTKSTKSTTPSALNESFQCNGSLSNGISPSRTIETPQCSISHSNGISSSSSPIKTSFRESTSRNDGLQMSTTKKNKNKKMKKKKKRKQKVVQIDGTVLNNVEKVEAYRKSAHEISDADDDNAAAATEGNRRKEKKDESDILQSLFQSSGIHSALKHDRIEQAGNPDYVLVEKEAERVAKQAIKALRQSRTQCRANGFSVPTWTGNSNSTVISAATQPKKKRFGKSTNINTAAVEPSSGSSSKDTLFSSGSNSVTTVFDLESESIDLSSSALLARMRRRNAAVMSTQPQGNEETSQAEESVLLKDIEQYMLSRADRAATSDELTSFFKARLKTGQNALFKELLKQICTFEKKDGVGTWRLKEEFTTV